MELGGGGGEKTSGRQLRVQIGRKEEGKRWEERRGEGKTGKNEVKEWNVKNKEKW